MRSRESLMHTSAASFPCWSHDLSLVEQCGIVAGVYRGERVHDRLEILGEAHSRSRFWNAWVRTVSCSRMCSEYEDYSGSRLGYIDWFLEAVGYSRTGNYGFQQLCTGYEIGNADRSTGGTDGTLNLSEWGQNHGWWRPSLATARLFKKGCTRIPLGMFCGYLWGCKPVMGLSRGMGDGPLTRRPCLARTAEASNCWAGTSCIASRESKLTYSLTMR
jgi:hypothetical protein